MVTIPCRAWRDSLATHDWRSGREVTASWCVPSSPSLVNTFQRFAAITAIPAKSAVCFSECAVKPLHPHWFFISSKTFSQSPRSR